MLYSYFGKEESFNMDFFKAAVISPAAKDGIPATFIAFYDNEPAGSVCLWRSDMLSRQDLTPWLANLFVKEEFRKNHIGSALQKQLVSYAKELGFEKVWLYTDLVDYYEKTGWQQCDRGVETDGKVKRIYYI
ncbi:MAG: GNAT family N-acetyltransferase [Clostridiales bacterium]|nr:MAG: GNAT family N-acetyltransferase [Clostridiales bacterium]